MPAGVSAYTALANVTLGSSSSGVTFSSINQGYRDLVAIIQVKSTTGFQSTFMNQYVNDFPFVEMRGSGSTAASSSGSQSGLRISDHLYYNNLEFMIAKIQIFDYSTTDKHKPGLLQGNFEGSAGPGVEAIAFRSASTSAITSLSFTPSVNEFAAGSTFALYGVSA